MILQFKSMFNIIFFIFFILFILPAFFLRFGKEDCYSKGLRVCYLIFVLFLLTFIGYITYNTAVFIV